MRNPRRKLCKLQNHTSVEEGWARGSDGLSKRSLLQFVLGIDVGV